MKIKEEEGKEKRKPTKTIITRTADGREENCDSQLTKSQQILSFSIPGIPAAQTGGFLIREQDCNTSKTFFFVREKSETEHTFFIREQQ